MARHIFALSRGLCLRPSVFGLVLVLGLFTGPASADRPHQSFGLELFSGLQDADAVNPNFRGSSIVVSTTENWQAWQIHAMDQLTINAGITLSTTGPGALLIQCSTLTVNGCLSVSGKGRPGGIAEATGQDATGSVRNATTPTCFFFGAGGGGGGTDQPGGYGGGASGQGGTSAAHDGGQGGSVSHNYEKEAYLLFHDRSYLLFGGHLGAGGGGGDTDERGTGGAGGAGGGILYIEAEDVVLGANGAIVASGSGGGGGIAGSSHGTASSGGGGGGGGLVILKCRTFTDNGGTVSAAGGGGGGGACSTDNANLGDGGHGGGIWPFSAGIGGATYSSMSAGGGGGSWGPGAKGGIVGADGDEGGAGGAAGSGSGGGGGAGGRNALVGNAGGAGSIIGGGTGGYGVGDTYGSGAGGGGGGLAGASGGQGGEGYDGSSESGGSGGGGGAGGFILVLAYEGDGSAGGSGGGSGSLTSAQESTLNAIPGLIGSVSTQVQASESVVSGHIASVSTQLGVNSAANGTWIASISTEIANASSTLATYGRISARELQTDQILWPFAAYLTGIADSTRYCAVIGRSAYPYSGTFTAVVNRADSGSTPAVLGWNTSQASGISYSTAARQILDTTPTEFHFLTFDLAPSDATGNLQMTIMQRGLDNRLRLGGVVSLVHEASMTLPDTSVVSDSELASAKADLIELATGIALYKYQRAQVAIASTTRTKTDSNAYRNPYDLAFVPGCEVLVFMEITDKNGAVIGNAVIANDFYEGTNALAGRPFGVTQTTMASAISQLGLSGLVQNVTPDTGW